ncbi:MAG: HPr kinase/phosphorylase [Caulobacter sp.]|jgi:serine kinase of HPr protein (carbohydrate metabolism regulator)|nr:HPr kinase/phosphorylase [Caulobacter sp.]
MTWYGGLVARAVAGHWVGALIEGPSGAGKSDLALRSLTLGARLVADDRVILWRSQDRLFGRAPDSLSGLLEVRGVGITRVTPLRLVEIGLVIACQPGPETVERMPDQTFVDRLGVRLPLRPLWPLEPAAPRKLLAMMEQL